jgi:CHASE3 domain sensor protein
MKLSNLPIGTRLGAGFALVLLMLIGVATLVFTVCSNPTNPCIMW